MKNGKNKLVTFLLISAVTLVWGIIIYQVFSSDLTEDHPLVVARPTAHEAFDKYSQETDTFRLALNYRDPFIVGSVPSPVPAVSYKPMAEVVKPAKVVPVMPDWSGIKYSGYIINPKTRQLVSILSVNGKERMIAEGEGIEGVKLLKNKRDSILVTWKGIQKYIRQ